MDIFDLNINEFEEEMQKIVNSYSAEELLVELKKCGYKQDECVYIEENISKEKYSAKEVLENTNVCIEISSLENDSSNVKLEVAA